MKQAQQNHKSLPSDSMLMLGRLLNPKVKKNGMKQVSTPVKNIGSYGTENKFWNIKVPYSQKH